MKYINYIVLLLLLSATIFFKDSLSLSTNLLSLFAPKASVEKLDIATELGYSRELLIGVKGFDVSSQNIVEELVEKLKKLKSIESIQYSTKPSEEIEKYYQDNYLLLSNFNTLKHDSTLVQKKLESIQKERVSSFIYTPIDKNDPLKLFSMKENNTHLSSKGKYISLGDFGYLLHIQTNVAPSQMNEARLLYKDVKDITNKYTNVIAFSGFFYTVENASKIKEDVLLIAIFSILILFIIYIVILKNIKILFHTLLALFSSTLFATLGSLFMYDDFHVISLAFGISITAVSIDYLFHYYFHDFYEKKKKIDKNVLYGFLTTLSAFVVFTFIPVTLIAQISFFTVLSLSFSYILFTFVFKGLKFRSHIHGTLSVKNYSVIFPSIIFAFSVFLLGYSFVSIKLDTNIRNLDYQNEELYAIENIFKNSTKNALSPVLVSASSQEKLISHLHTLKAEEQSTFSLANFIQAESTCLERKRLLVNYDFKELNTLVNQESSKLGFRNNYFENAYKFTGDIPSCSVQNPTLFESYNLKIINRDENFYTLAFVSHPRELEKYSFVSSINVKSMFKSIAGQMYKDISMYAFIVLCIVISLLYISVRRRFLYALSYIIFPLSLTLAFVVTFFDVNIMHIFGFIILIAIGIDYGIYMSNTQKPQRTMLAIKYSLLSTFGAFGVLVFSSITALHSIGLVISLGVLSIFFLIKVMK